jgi:transposase
VVTRDEFLDIHEAWARGRSVGQIARETGKDRKTIRRMLREGGPQPRVRRDVRSKLDPFRGYLVERMVTDKVTNATVLYDEIRAKGYRGGLSILREFLKPLRELVADDERATVRFETAPGQQAQVDWGEFKKPGRKRVHGFVLTLGWSRAMHLYFADSQALAGFLRCHEHAFEQLGGVPAGILYDRGKTVWLRDDDRQRPVFHPALLDFARYYGYEPKLCRAHGVGFQ